MTSFAAIYRARKTISNEYFRAIQDAQEARQIEYDAAMKIKKAWKKYQYVQSCKHRTHMATKIQNVFRRFLAKREVNCLRVEQARAKRIKFFNDSATKIQRMWRGYEARRHTFDYYKQQDYLLSIAHANQQMYRELDDYNAETADYLRTAKFNKENLRQEQIALHQHHLVSTAAIPSIFQPPSFAKDSGALPPVENFIRTVNKAKLCIPSVGKV